MSLLHVIGLLLLIFKQKSLPKLSHYNDINFCYCPVQVYCVIKFNFWQWVIEVNKCLKKTVYSKLFIVLSLAYWFNLCWYLSLALSPQLLRSRYVIWNKIKLLLKITEGGFHYLKIPFTNIVNAYTQNGGQWVLLYYWYTLL